MSEKPKSQLPLLLGVLAVVGGLVWWDRAGQPSTPDAPVAAVGRGAPPEVPTGAGDAAVHPQRARSSAGGRLVHPLAGLPLAGLSETVNRPLFEPSRRTPVVVRPPPTAAPPPPPPPQLQAPVVTHRLLCVVLGPEGAVAVLAQDNGSSVRAEIGDSVDGWQVERITREEVQLVREGRRHVLRVTRK